eukprot:CAMPEP_0172820776 /NCGR_PEP_ID=MMETSP1075-20121228/15485_1 /TAXON_ID=2916 /ORGANISM="Ceratium fusus, Strain PA161109" /LENGTH=548 /DNA_ID=CAMNT_0013661499 /DNA_START=119 /DNA_END=1765 /DNA_ORIENTATION=-
MIPPDSPLLLLHEETYDEEKAKTHLVTDLPGLPFGYSHRMYAGQVSVHEQKLQNKGSIFYWLVESKHHPESDPLVIWINGGPGCSSLEGLLVEHGPFLAVATGFDLELNPYSWNHKANVLYIDQPVGTGYAVVHDGAYARSQEEVNVMFMAFLQRWMNLHPRFKGRRLFLAGESYAGRYIPHFAHQILAAGKGFNLEGVMIGNGWTYPMVQSASFPEYSLAQGLISQQQKRDFDILLTECHAKYNHDPYSQETWNVCERIQTSVPTLSGDNKVGKINVYDVRLYDTTAGGDWPWRETGEKSYLNRAQVRKALHVQHQIGWEECSDKVEEILTHEDMYPTVDEFKAMLPLTRVLVYNGQFDWICNHLGVERFLDGLNFEGSGAFLDPHRRGEWVSGSRLAGYVKQGGNLTFVLVLGGSHMVPMDKRSQTEDLLQRFLNNRSFTDVAVLGLESQILADDKFVVEQRPRVEQHLSNLEGFLPHAVAGVQKLAATEAGGQMAFDTLSSNLFVVSLVSLGIVLGSVLSPLMHRAWDAYNAQASASDRYAPMMS